MHLVIPFPGVQEEFSMKKALRGAATEYRRYRFPLEGERASLYKWEGTDFSGLGSPFDPVPCLMGPSCFSSDLFGVPKRCVSVKTSRVLSRGTELILLRSVCGDFCRCWWGWRFQLCAPSSMLIGVCCVFFVLFLDDGERWASHDLWV